MADSPKLNNPRVRVVMADGAELEVQTLNPDLLKWDETAPRHGWPKFETAPVFWLTFITYCALKREGQIPDSLKWDHFKDQALDVSTIGGTEVDPTNPDHGAG